MLAECVTEPDEMLEALNRSGGKPCCFPLSLGTKIHVFTRLPESSLIEQFCNPLGDLTIRQLHVGNEPGMDANRSFETCVPNQGGAWERVEEARRRAICHKS
jgi:hypothetical protein